MQICIKHFTELSTAELYSLLELRSEVFVLEQKCPYADVDGLDPLAWHLLCEQDGELAASLRILPRGVGHEQLSIGRVVTRGTYRKRGIAAQILDAAVKFVFENTEECEIMLSAQVYAAGLYKAAGFVQVSEQYLEDDIPHIDMVLRRSGDQNR